MIKTVYITIDIEEWYHLEYLREYGLKSTGVTVIPQIIDFLDLLDNFNIKATFFVVAEIAEINADILREIADRGHSIGCHGWDHRLLFEKSNDNYYEEIIKAKELIEKIIEMPVQGYRASCFSMDRDKLNLTEKAGYTFDSSRILFEQHPLYRNFDLHGFNKEEDLVYKKGSFIEYEIPTLRIGRFNIPISGGGYLRLLPYWLLKLLLINYKKQHSNIMLYLHPFELTSIDLPLPKNLSIKTKFRVLVGRKHNLRKFEKLILLLRHQGAEFRTLSYDRTYRLGV